jgi:hypothetical protein
VLGLVMRYCEDGPPYAWWRYSYGDIVRIGACSSDQAARAAVERALERDGATRFQNWYRATCDGVAGWQAQKPAELVVPGRPRGGHVEKGTYPGSPAGSTNPGFVDLDHWPIGFSSLIGLFLHSRRSRQS